VYFGLLSEKHKTPGSRPGLIFSLTQQPSDTPLLNADVAAEARKQSVLASPALKRIFNRFRPEK